MSGHRWLTVALLGSVLLGGCAGGPAVVRSDLPVRRVVLYRNGVGYFERGGRTDEDELRFQVRRRDVGDFLTSLAVVDHTGAPVRSVSFEVPERDERAEPRPIPLVVHDGRLAIASPPGGGASSEEAEDEEEAPLEVVLRMAPTGEHDLRVSYVVGTPLWRPTYRLVFGEEGGLLQAWAVVQNRSGEDWENVRLSVTTGAPIAFRSDLGTPIVPQRPLVSDRGEVLAVVPRSHGTLPQEAAMLGAAPPEPSARSRRAERRAHPRGAPAPAAAPLPLLDAESGAEASSGYRLEQASGALDVAAQARSAPGGVTRYDLAQPVTVPDGGSTMVALLSRRVPGEVAHLYAPKPSTSDPPRHPFRVARFENRTGAMLARGPVTIFEGGEFVGQGVLEPLAAGATAFLPFALDRSVVVDRWALHNEEPGRLVAITRGRVTVEVFKVQETRYRVRNGRSKSIVLYVRHPRRGGMDLVEPTEHIDLTDWAAVFPLRIGAHEEGELRVRERSPISRTVDFLSELGARVVGLYLEGAAADLPLAPKLREALRVREELVKVQRRRKDVEQARREAERNAEQVRRSLESLRRVERAGDLRQRLVRRLAEIERRLEAMTRQLVELQEQERVLRVQLEELLQGITLRAEAPAG